MEFTRINNRYNHYLFMLVKGLMVIIFLLTISGIKLIAQGNVGIGTTTPDPSAILELKSTSQGLIIPRMSDLDRISIPPIKGLMVYDTITSTIWYADGFSWVDLGNTLALEDRDKDTRITVENSNDIDDIRFIMAGQEFFRMDSARLEVLNSGQSVFIGEQAGFRDDLNNNYNVAIGYHALRDNVTGSDNVAIGDFTLSKSEGNENVGVGDVVMFNNESGSYNTALGSESLVSSEDDLNNSAVGYRSLTSLNGGGSNSVLGSNTLEDLQAGSHNVGIGFLAGGNLTQGDANVIMGSNALLSTTSATESVIIGSAAMHLAEKANKIIAIGDSALYQNGKNALNNGQGIENLAIGSRALALNDKGSFNIAIGTEALENNTGEFPFSSNNTAIGVRALWKNFDASDNTAVGYQALRENINSEGNTAVGSQALIFSKSGESNTAIGAAAHRNNLSGSRNVVVGQFAFFQNQSGYDNVIVGQGAASQNIVGDQNVIIGKGAGQGTVHDSLSGNIMIGYNAGSLETNSNRLYIENSNSDEEEALIFGEFDNDLIRFNGQVEIKSSTTVEALLLLEPSNAPGSPVPGMIYFDKNNENLYLYRVATGWTQLN